MAHANPLLTVKSNVQIMHIAFSSEAIAQRRPNIEPPSSLGKQMQQEHQENKYLQRELDYVSGEHADPPLMV